MLSVTIHSYLSNPWATLHNEICFLSTVRPTGAKSFQSAKFQTVTNRLSVKLKYQVGIFHHLLCLDKQVNRSDLKQFTLASLS